MRLESPKAGAPPVERATAIAPWKRHRWRADEAVALMAHRERNFVGRDLHYLRNNRRELRRLTISTPCDSIGQADGSSCACALWAPTFARLSSGGAFGIWAHAS